MAAGSKLFEQILLYIEIEEEKKSLRQMGLSDEEIEGYFELYAENYISEIKDTTTCQKKD